MLRKAGKGLSQDEVKIEVMIYVKQLPKHITSLKVVWHPKLYLNKRHNSQIISILWQQYTLPYLHVAEVCATKCGLHCEAVSNSHLAPHDNTCCRLLALAHTELTPTERELVRSLGQRNHILLKGRNFVTRLEFSKSILAHWISHYLICSQRLNSQLRRRAKENRDPTDEIVSVKPNLPHKSALLHNLKVHLT